MMRLFLVILLLNSTITAQNWTLQQCIDSALANSNSLMSLDLESAISATNIKTAKWSILPSLNATATHGYNWGQIIDPFTNQFATSRVQYNNFYASSSMTLFNGLRNYYSIKINEIDYQSQIYNRQIEERNLKMEVAAGYLQVLLNAEYLSIVEQHLLLTKDQKDRIQRLVDAEKEPQNKLLQVKAEEAKDNYGILKAKNELQYSLLLLQQLINRPKTNDSLFTIEKIDEFEVKPIEGLELSELPEMELAALKIEQQSLEIKSERGKLFPSLSINGSIGSGYSENNRFLTPSGQTIPKPFGDQFNENLYQSASLALNIPIFNKNSTKFRMSINEFKLAQLELDKEQQVLVIQNKITQLELDAMNAQAQYDAALVVVESASLNYENARIQFENNAINNVQFLEAKDVLFTAQSEAIQAKYSSKVKAVIRSFFDQAE